MRILLIENEQELSKSMMTYLQRESYSCDAAYTLKEEIDNILEFSVKF